MTKTNLSRRYFLQSTTAGMLASGVAPVVLGADKSGRKPKVIGVDGHRFEVHHDCMEVPDHIRWQDTHGVAVDAEGLIYVKHRTKTKERMDAVVVFDAKGRFVRSFGKEYHGGGHGIDIRKEGGEEFLYLSDNKGYIAKTTLTGETVWKQTAPKLAAYAGAAPFVVKTPGKYGKGKKFIPTNIAFAPDGGFFVGDGYGSNYIIRYDKDAKPIGHFGGTGSEPGKFKTPHGLWWDDRPGREAGLAICDRANARLQYVDAEGEPTAMVDDLLFPADIDIRGEVMVVPDLHARITLLDKDNQVITHLGDDPEWRKQVLGDKFSMRRQPARWESGRFIHPHDACFDHDGNLYVAEWVAIGRISFLRHVG
ncbi:MAG: peptidase [Limisphaerales bacterium]